MNLNYRLTSPVSIVKWGEETVVYNLGSSSTHIIVDVPSSILDVVFSGALFSDQDLVDALSLLLLDFNEDKKTDFLQAIKRQLIGMELIEII